jgi:hypothetical protein
MNHLTHNLDAMLVLPYSEDISPGGAILWEEAYKILPTDLVITLSNLSFTRCEQTLFYCFLAEFDEDDLKAVLFINSGDLAS